MQTRSVRVRIYLAAAAMAAGTIACGENPARPSSVPGATVDARGAIAGPSATPADDGFPVSADLAAVRRATAHFHDLSTAHAAGYTTENEPCVASPDGVMGIHAPNLALIGDQALDPERPEALLYAPKPGGGYRLTGVEYVEIVLLRNPATNEVAPWISQDPWPADYEVVTATPTLFGQTFQGPMPGHTPTMPWHWDLHAWIWAPNPSGMFAEWNPSLRCE